MKKKIYLVLAAAAAAVLLTACAQSGDNGNTSDTKETTNTAASGTADAGSTQEAGDNTAPEQTYDGANQGEDSPEQTYDTVNQGEDEVTGQEADATLTETNWSGTYESGTGESVTITAADDGGSFSFIFSQSGIGGQASCDVNQGIFEGDDGYVVTFSLDDDNLNISVSSDTDENAGDSALAGTYSRQ